MQETERIIAEDVKNDAEVSDSVGLNIIQQSDENGKQKNVKPRFSLGFYICECFKVPSFCNFRKNSMLLPPKQAEFMGKNTLVLDLDETLVHSSFTSVPCDMRFTISLNRQKFAISVLKRPGLENFLKACTSLFEVVIFTASLEDYASPLIDQIDEEKKIAHRLYRGSCSLLKCGYVKDLSRIGRDLNSVIIVDV